MSSEETRDTVSQGVQTVPHLAAQARNLARSDASYHYETVTFNIRREPSNTGSLIEVAEVFRRTRIPGLEYNKDPKLQCYTFGSETLVREVGSSAFQKRRIAAGNASAIGSIHPFLTSLANSAAPAGKKVGASAQTDPPSRVITRAVDSDDEVEYIKTVYPVNSDSSANTVSTRAPRRPHPTRQSKMADFFSHRKIKLTDLPPSLIAALSKSEATSKGFFEDYEKLKKDIAELLELKAEADALFDEIQARFQPSSVSHASTSVATSSSISATASTSDARVSAAPGPASPPTSTSDARVSDAPASPQTHTNGSLQTQDPANSPVCNHPNSEISDQQYLSGRIVSRSGKRRATSLAPLKRRASSDLAPAAKKPRTED